MTLRKLIAVAALMAVSVPAYADGVKVFDADGTEVIKKTKTIGGQEADQDILIDSAGNELCIVGSSPPANSLCGRLKSIEDKLTTLNAGVTLSGTPSVTGTVTVGSSALPTGAATATKQPALGTAGTPSSDVLTIQGATNASPIPVRGASDGAADSNGSVKLGGVGPDGNKRAAAISSGGVLASPNSGACDGSGTNGCRETHTNLGADSGGTIICPATADVYAVTIYNTAADVGISFSGSTGMTSRTLNATSLTTSPSFNIATAGQFVTVPVGFTSNITAHGAAQWIACYQWIRK